MVAGPGAATASTALSGADVRSLAAGAPGSAWVYAGTQGDGVLRSSDGGLSWQPAGLRGEVVKALATSGPAAATVWAATKPPRLYRSRDAGESWEELHAFGRMRRPWWRQPAERPFTAYVSTLAVIGAEPEVVVAGIEAFKLLRSEDAGVTWGRIGRGIPFDAHELAADARGRLLLAAGGGAAISTDSGASWTRLKDGLDRRYAFCVAPDYAVPDSAYLAAAPMFSAHSANSRACIFRLDGQRWRMVHPELAELPNALATSPAQPGVVYAGLRDGTILHSPDRGDSWEVMPLKLNGVRRLALTDVLAT